MLGERGQIVWGEEMGKGLTVDVFCGGGGGLVSVRECG